VLLKAYVKPETADAFKARCRGDGASVSGKIVELIGEHLAGGRKPAARASATYAVKTRAMRRIAIAAAIGMVEATLEAETEYMENIPPNLQNSQVHDAAEQTVDTLEEALGILGDAYQ